MVRLTGAGLGADSLAIGSAGGSNTAFNIRFERVSKRGLEEVLKRDAIAVRGASKDAVIETTRQVKNLIRAYIDAHFTGSEWHGNAHRRVANASAQEKFYDEIEGKGQFAGLVYSKFGKRDAGGFVDYLLLHVRGGTVPGSPWLRLVNDEAGGTAGSVAQSGFFSFSQSNIFFVESKDGKKLYQLRRYKKGSSSGKAGKTELLATLVKQLVFKPTLSGIDEIARRRPELFDQNFAAALQARTGQQGQD